MNNKMIVPLLVVSGISAISTELLAAAPPTLEEVIVTAQKREQSLSDVGITITAASSEKLQLRKIESINDLPQIVPGLTVQRAGFNSVSFTLRGIGFFNSDLSTPPAVTVYVDEAPIPYPAMSQLSAFDLERVEVVKGPQGTLYGQNATGGAINYITAKPTDTFEAGVDLSYGRFNRRSANGFVSGPLTDSLNARLALRTAHADEWQSSTTRSGDELGAVEEYQGRLTLDYDPTERFRSTLSLSLEVDKSDTLAAQFIGYIAQVPGSESPALATYPIVKEPRAADWTPMSLWRSRAAAWSGEKYSPPSGGYEKDNEHFKSIWRNEFTLADDLVLTSLTSYGKFETDYVQDFDGTSNLNFNIENYGSSVRSFTQELRLSHDTERMRLLGGLNYHRDKTDDTPIQTYIDNSSAHAFEPAFGIVAEGGLNYGKHDVDSYAAFGNVEYDIVPDITLQLGLRYNTEKRTYNGCAEDIGGGGLAETLTTAQIVANDGAPPVVIGINDCYVLDPDNNFRPVSAIKEELDEDNVAWKAGLTWRPTADAIIYGHVSRGFKAGTVPLVGASTKVQYKPVKQESVIAYEVGTKSGWFDGRAQMNLAAFYYDYQDKQLRGRILDPIFGPLEALVAIPESRVYGVEGQFLAQPVQGLLLDLAFTYVDSKIEEFEGFSGIGEFGDFSGTSFPYSPEWQVTADVSYEFPLVAGWHGFVGAALTHQSHTSGGIGEPEILDIDAYTLLDLRAGMEDAQGRYRVMIWGKNVTDEYYWSNAMMTYDTVVRFVNMPATYGIDLSYRW